MTGWLSVLIGMVLGLGPQVSSWYHVLDALDARRAVAFASGDPRRLDAVYVPGSPAAQADSALMASYSARGLVVRGARMELVEVEPVAVADDRVELTVVERLERSTAVWADGTRRDLPSGLPVRLHVVLERTGAGWRIASTTPAG